LYRRNWEEFAKEHNQLEKNKRIFCYNGRKRFFVGKGTLRGVNTS